MSFTHLHLHTEYSLLDGACRIEQLMDEVQRLGQTSVAVTDHGVMYGVIDFYRAAKKHGIKPIIGCEVYMAARTRFDKIHALDSERYHLILLCENETGYKNLIKLVSEGFVTGFYTKPRIDRELLEKYHEGLIALSACIAGEIPRALLSGDYEGVSDEIGELKQVCGEHAMKVILETGDLATASNIKKASILAMYAGADYIKTSTGKEKVSATPEAAYVMCQAIKEYYDETGIQIGFKPAGGINTVMDAVIYYTIVKEVLGEKWLTNKWFRIGTSRLANLLLSELVGEETKFF